MYFFPITPSGWRLRGRAKVLFKQIVARSREPVFYEDFCVPDTLDGRFEMIALHTGFVVNKVRAGGRMGTRLAQSLFDEMFLNMEISCRQLGVGDLSVQKHIKTMMKAFHGRALYYEDAASQGEGAVIETLKRNLYGTTEAPPENVLKTMAQYIIASQKHMQAHNFDELAKGNVEFAPLPQKEGHQNDKASQVA